MQQARAPQQGSRLKGKIPDPVSIHKRPPGIEDGQFPGHWESELTGGEANGSVLGTPVKRKSRFLVLVKPIEAKPDCALNALQDFTNKLLSIALLLRLSTTQAKGLGMTMHKELSQQALPCAF